MNNRSLISAGLLAFFVSGCAIGPDYAKPSTPTPHNFRYGDTNQTHPSVREQWWTSFNDPLLNRAIETTLTNNYDLRMAQSSVDALLGKFDQAKAYLYPQITANGSLDRKGVSNALNNGYMLREGVTPTYAASLSLVSYEIDLVGKVRRTNEAARAQLLSGEYARQTLAISTASSVAVSYFNLASLKGQLALAHENVTISHEIAQQTGLKYRLGAINEGVYLQAQSSLENAQATLSQLESTKIAEESNLNLLLGRNPQSIETSDLTTLTLPTIPAALPSEVLTHRPDIALAEQNLISANAQIGIAKAAYYPSIKLTGMLGQQSLDLTSFVSNPAKIWELTPSLTLPIFTAGAIEGGVKVAEAEHAKTLLQYQKTIVAAFNDADTALGQNTAAKERLKHQTLSTQAIQKAFEQARLRYKVGSIAYTDLLVVQQQWLQASQAQLIAHQNALIQSVNLYKALGGGWDANASTFNVPNLAPSGR